MITENKKRTVTGVVISAKRQNTITVKVEWSRRHPKYGKVMRHFTKYHVHDPQSLAAMGDTVHIQECRPISKTKSWVLTEIVEKNAEHVS